MHVRPKYKTKRDLCAWHSSSAHKAFSIVWLPRRNSLRFLGIVALPKDSWISTRVQSKYGRNVPSNFLRTTSATDEQVCVRRSRPPFRIHAKLLGKPNNFLFHFIINSLISKLIKCMQIPCPDVSSRASFTYLKYC